MHIRSGGPLVAVLLAVAAGCNRGPDRTPVSGTVTFKGKPVPSALITFRPAPGVSGPPASTPVVDGHYEFGDENGPVAARYEVLVRITDSGGKSGPTRKLEAGSGDEAPAGAVWLIKDVEITPEAMSKDIDLKPEEMNPQA